MGDWKAVRLGPGEALELYNLKTDLGETNNVAAANPEVVQDRSLSENGPDGIHALALLTAKGQAEADKKRTPDKDIN
jgi:hypothetical protein